MRTIDPMSVKDDILVLLSETPGLSDRELTDRIAGPQTHPSQVNQACRQLEQSGHITRQPRSDGRTGNYPTGTAPPDVAATQNTVRPSQGDGLSEDEVKRHLQSWLEKDGWQTEIAWGRARGIDILAKRNGLVWIIEAKGSGSLQAMRVNYFTGMLGELLQRMSLPDARYSIAMPDLAQFRGLWGRLPALARQRTGISALFVKRDGTVDHDKGTA